MIYRPWESKTQDEYQSGSGTQSMHNVSHADMPFPGECIPMIYSLQAKQGIQEPLAQNALA